MKYPSPLFESGCDQIDVSRMRRPDVEGWRVTDKHGHRHQWYADGKPAKTYDPMAAYTTPTLAWVRDDTGYYEDGQAYEIGHYECVKCRESVEPQFRSDDVQVFIPGLRWYRIDGKPVSEEEYRRVSDEYRQAER